MGKNKWIGICGISLLACGGMLFGVSSTWTGNAGDDLWGTANNWSDGVPDGAEDTAIFNFAPESITMGADRSLRALVLKNNALTQFTEGSTFQIVLQPTGNKSKSVSYGSYGLPLAFNSTGNLKVYFNKRLGAEFLVLKTVGDAGTVTIAPQGNAYSGIKRGVASLAGTDTYTSSTVMGNFDFYPQDAITYGGPFTINKGGRFFVYNGTQTFTDDYTINKGATLSMSALSVESCAVNLQGATTNRGTINLYGVAGFTADHLVNTGSFNIPGGNPNVAITTFTNAGRVTCSATRNVNGMSFGFVTNNRKKTMTFKGVQTNSTLNPEYSIIGGVNNGNINVTESAALNFVTSDFTNNGTISVYGVDGATIASIGHTAPFTNAGKIFIYGVANSPNAGVGTFLSNGTFTNINKANISVYERGILSLGAGFPFTNQDEAQVNVYGFGGLISAGPINHLSSRNINVFENGTMQVDSDTLTHNSSGNMNFYGYGTLQLGDGAASNGTLNKQGTGLINFYGESRLFVSTAASKITLSGGSLNCFGNSWITLDGIFELGNASFKAYGDTFVEFEGPSTIQDDGAPTTAEFLVYGNARVDINSTGGSTISSPISVYQNGELALGANLSNSDITVGNANRKLAGGALSATGTSGAKSVSLINGGGFLAEVGTDFTIVNDYSEISSSQFGVELEVADGGGGETKVTVGGDAALAGELYINFEEGHDTGNFTFLTTTGSLNGTTFRNHVVVSGETGVTVTYPGNNSVLVNLPAASERLNMVMPTNVKTLKGNNQSIAKHLLKSSPQVQKSKDFKRASASITQQSEKYFKKSLGQLHPSTHLAARKVGVKKTRGLLKDFNHAIDVQRKFQKVFKRENEQKGPSFKAPQNPQVDFFVNSIKVSSELTKVGASKYASKSGGANFGWTKVYPSNWLLEAGFGCLESSVSSLEKLGSLESNSAYFAPTLAYLGDQAYFNAMLITGLSQYDQKRAIHFPHLNPRVAQATYSGLDLGVQLAGGLKFELGDHLNWGLDLAILAQESSTFEYRETGANSLNLTVLEQKMQSVHPSMKLFASHEMYQNGHALKGSIYLNASSDLYLTDGVVESHLSFLDKEDAFETRSSLENSNKATLGADISFKTSHNFECSAHVESDALKGFKNNLAEMKFNWLF